jgi:hypothetical protein
MICRDELGTREERRKLGNYEAMKMIIINNNNSDNHQQEQ